MSHRRLSLPVEPPTLLGGVEQEYQLVGSAGQLDFRPLVAQVAGSLVTRDPGDPRARRLPNGVGLTADGWEAELVTPPAPISSTALPRHTTALACAKDELARELAAIGEPATLVGFSTHLNVSVPDDDLLRVARVVADGFTGALDDLVDAPDRTGWLVRPRRGRLEVGTDFLDGGRLLHALALVAAIAHGLASGEEPQVAERSRAVPSREKFGHFVAPHDLAPASAATVAWVDRQLAALGLPAARDRPAYDEVAAVRAESEPVDAAPRERDGLSASCTWLTWQHAAWTVVDERGRSVVAVVPATVEAAFLADLDAGRLDAQLRTALRSRRRRALLTHRDLDAPALWSTIRPGALVPAERLTDGSVPGVSRRHARRDLRAWTADAGRTAVPRLDP